MLSPPYPRFHWCALCRHKACATVSPTGLPGFSQFRFPVDTSGVRPIFVVFEVSTDPYRCFSFFGPRCSSQIAAVGVSQSASTTSRTLLQQDPRFQKVCSTEAEAKGDIEPCSRRPMNVEGRKPRSPQDFECNFFGSA